VDEHKKSVRLGRNPHLKREMWGTLIAVQGRKMRSGPAGGLYRALARPGNELGGLVGRGAVGPGNRLGETG
jgi:hypothetical protein